MCCPGAIQAASNLFLKLTIENQLYVAKQFFNIGSGTTVSAQDNETFLTGELIRLKTVDWFLNEFKALAETNSADISTGWYSVHEWFIFSLKCVLCRRPCIRRISDP
jgi:hypothetical protein